jgi:hypothetical protein
VLIHHNLFQEGKEEDLRACIVGDRQFQCLQETDRDSLSANDFAEQEGGKRSESMELDGDRKN